MTDFRALIISAGTQQQLSATDGLLVGTGIDATSSGPLSIGLTNAIAITLQKNTTLAAGRSLFIPTDGRIDTSAAGTLSIGTSTATSIAIGQSSVTTLNLLGQTVNIGAASGLVNILGDMNVAGDVTTVGNTVFESDAVFQGNVTFGAPLVNDAVADAGTTDGELFYTSTAGDYVGNQVRMVSGAAATATALITANDGTKLTVGGLTGILPGDTFDILGPDTVSFDQDTRVVTNMTFDGSHLPTGLATSAGTLSDAANVEFVLNQIGGAAQGGEHAIQLANATGGFAGEAGKFAYDLANSALTAEGTAVFNDANSSSGDFKVKGQTDDNTLFVDASADSVGVGTATPNEKLTVEGTLSLDERDGLPSFTDGYGKLVIADSALAASIDGSAGTSASDNRPYFVDGAGQAYNLTQDRFNTLASGATVTLDLNPALPIYNTVTLGENTTIACVNIGAGRGATLRITSAAQRTITLNASWKLLGSELSNTVTLPAGATGILAVVAYGTSDADIVASWSYDDQAVALSGSGVDNQIAVWSGTYTQDGSTSFTWDGSEFKADGSAVFNESGADKDFRVEGASSTHMLFVDASTNRVGINEAIPQATLDVEGSLRTENGAVNLLANAASKFSTSSGALTIDAAGALDLDGASVTIDSNTTSIGMTAANGMSLIATTGTMALDAMDGALTLEGHASASLTSGNGAVSVTASTSVAITSQNASDITLTSAKDFTATVAGAASLTTSGGDISLVADSADAGKGSILLRADEVTADAIKLESAGGALVVAPAGMEIDTGAAAETVAVLTLDNSVGDTAIFIDDSAPAAGTGAAGDLAQDATAGVLYSKEAAGASWTGSSPSSAGWERLVSEQYAEGFFLGGSESKIHMVQEGGQWATLQDAVDAAADGDTILVGPKATSWGAVAFPGGKRLSVIGMANGPEQKDVIVGKLSFAPTADPDPNKNTLYLANLFINESAAAGEALIDFAGTQAGRVRLSHMYLNKSSGDGDGIVVQNSDAGSSFYIDDSIVDSQDFQGVGIKHVAGYTDLRNRVWVRRWANAMTCAAGDLAVDNCRFEGNIAGSYIDVTGGTLSMGYSYIANANAAATGLSVSAGARAAVSATSFNVAAGSGKAVTGAGIYLYGDVSYGLDSLNNLTVDVAISSPLIRSGGAFKDNLAMDGDGTQHKITGLAECTDPFDAANKAYVDEQITNIDAERLEIDSVANEDLAAGAVVVAQWSVVSGGDALAGTNDTTIAYTCDDGAFVGQSITMKSGAGNGENRTIIGSASNLLTLSSPISGLLPGDKFDIAGEARVRKASAASGSTRVNPLGTVKEAKSAGQPVRVLVGGSVSVPSSQWIGAPAQADIGKRVWVNASSTNTNFGKITLTPPANVGEILQRVGVLATFDGSTPKVLLQISDPIQL